MDESHYKGREQSHVKHLILKRYLLRFALITGPIWKSITYVDGFSGPWNAKSEDYEDTSFAIAIKQLREARDRLAIDGIDIELRAFFIEENKESFAQLEQYKSRIDDIEIKIHNGVFEDSIGKICEFVRTSKHKSFPFIFIDPKGWTGFALDVVRPLLVLNPCEVLINFMTQHIIRFIEHEESQASFERLFGSKDFAEDLKHLRQDDRADAAVFKYRDAVSSAGQFRYPGIAGILNPIKDRSHFHLIYLSRHPKGLDVFKDAEKKSMVDMETARAKLEQSTREAKSKQREFFDAEDAPESSYFRMLRDRYRQLAIADVETALNIEGRIDYDDAWNAWLRYPMVWESDLKEWLQQQATRIKIDGLTGRQRVPQRGKSHSLTLRAQ